MARGRLASSPLARFRRRRASCGTAASAVGAAERARAGDAGGRDDGGVKRVWCGSSLRPSVPPSPSPSSAGVVNSKRGPALRLRLRLRLPLRPPSGTGKRDSIGALRIDETKRVGPARRGEREGNKTAGLGTAVTRGGAPGARAEGMPLNRAAQLRTLEGVIERAVAGERAAHRRLVPTIPAVRARALGEEGSEDEAFALRVLLDKAGFAWREAAADAPRERALEWSDTPEHRAAAAETLRELRELREPPEPQTAARAPASARSGAEDGESARSGAEDGEPASKRARAVEDGSDEEEEDEEEEEVEEGDDAAPDDALTTVYCDACGKARNILTLAELAATEKERWTCAELPRLAADGFCERPDDEVVAICGPGFSLVLHALGVRTRAELAEREAEEFDAGQFAGDLERWIHDARHAETMDEMLAVVGGDQGVLDAFVAANVRDPATVLEAGPDGVSEVLRTALRWREGGGGGAEHEHDAALAEAVAVVDRAADALERRPRLFRDLRAVAAYAYAGD